MLPTWWSIMKMRRTVLWFLLFCVAPLNSMQFEWFRKEKLPQEGSVRLAGSKINSEGRVEIYHDGKWGTICDDGWDLAEAQVVCRQLHFQGARSFTTGGSYGEGSGPIWLDDMDCEGTEDVLSSCAHKGWAVTDCTHKEDVGVICDAGTNITGQLVNDTSYSLEHTIVLSEDLGQLFDSGKGCDFLIHVHSHTSNRLDNGVLEMVNSTVCTHRVILSLFPGFTAPEGLPSMSVHLSQTCQPHFTAFIRYVYTRKIDVTTSSAQCLHQLAADFGMKELMEDTGRLFTRLLPNDVTFYTQLSLYKYSVETGDQQLQENCLQYMAWNYESLVSSPAWNRLPVDLLGILLSRSDLVLPDEAFLLVSLERWISQMGNSTCQERQAYLLERVRFPMIPAAKLFELQFTSTLYKTHQNLFRDKMLKGFQAHVVSFGELKNSSTFEDGDYDYLPRIYTGQPWSAVIGSKNTRNPSLPRRVPPYGNRGRYDSYGYGYPTVSPYLQSGTKSFQTPAHNSEIYKNSLIQWEANVFTRQGDCSNRGLRCEKLPATRLRAGTSLSPFQRSIRFSNRLLVMCQERFICHILDFKNDLAYVSTNDGENLSYPCPSEQYSYRFVVRPEYI